MTPLPNIDMGFMEFARYVILKATVILIGGVIFIGCSITPHRCCEELRDGTGYIPCPDVPNAVCELGLY